MLGPAIVVVAGSYTAWLAVSHPEALVVDDYYKQGTAINQTLHRDHAAMEIGLRGRLEMTGDGKLDLRMTAKPDYAWPPIVELLLAHPTKSEDDIHVRLVAVELMNGQARYVADAPVLKLVAYQVVLQDGDQWRLLAEWPKDSSQAIELKPAITGP